MLGLAVGNVLGVPAEMAWHHDIAHWYPGGLRDIDWPPEYIMDDDLAQAVVIARSLIRDRDIPLSMAHRMMDWRDTNGHGCGNTTSRVIESMRDHAWRGSLRLNPFAAAEDVHADSPLEPNGGAMRCAPVAVARLYDPDALLRDSAETCAVTHAGELCQWSCILANVLIASLILDAPIPISELMADAGSDGMPDLQRVAEEARRLDFGGWSDKQGIPADIFRAANQNAPMPRDAGWLRVDQHIPAHTLVTLQAGLWAAETPLDFENALIEIVNAGGDTDTNGALAGAVLGARYGASAIPQRWLDGISSSENALDKADYVPHWTIRMRLLTGIADRMLDPPEALPPKPHPNTHWVVPGRLLAGEYPRNAEDDADSRAKMRAFLDAGFDTFIDLTEAGVMEPYAQWLPNGVRRVREPIRDGYVPDSADAMRRILDLIDSNLNAGGKTYLHCWGGRGRTGTVIGCWFARHEGEDLPHPPNGDVLNAAEQRDEVWQYNPKSTWHPRHTENKWQEDYVRDWMNLNTNR